MNMTEGNTMVEIDTETKIYEYLVSILHPMGLCCPRCQAREGLGIHRRRREPVIDYQCSACGRVFNAWTGTELEGIHRGPSEIMAIMLSIASGVPTAQIAKEIGCQRCRLIQLRRRLAPLVERLGDHLTRLDTGRGIRRS